MNHVNLLEKLVAQLQDIATWHELGDEGGAAGVCGGHVGDQGGGNAEGGGGP